MICTALQTSNRHNFFTIFLLYFVYLFLVFFNGSQTLQTVHGVLVILYLISFSKISSLPPYSDMKCIKFEVPLD